MSLKFMHSLDITLKEFVSQIPRCLQGDSLEKILEVVQSGNSETIAILNSQQYPVGIVNCNSLLCLLTQYCYDRSTVFISGDFSRNYNIRQSEVGSKVISVPTVELEALIQPVTIFNSQTTIEELLPYFQNHSLSRDKNPTYLIINPQGQLLGELDTIKLLQHLMLSSQNKSQQPLTSLFIDQHLISFLEAISLPLKLQTANNRVLYQNSCWLELFGETRLEAKPIAQWWLEQQQNRNIEESNDLTAPASDCYCPQGNNHLIPPLTIASLREINSQLTDNENYASYRSIDRHQYEPNSSSSASTTESHQWSYIQIPLELTHNNPLIRESSACYELVLAVPAATSPIDSHNSQEAELIQLNRLKDELLANISHELKSPLTGIVGLSNLLKEQKLGELNQRQLRYAELIYRGGRKLVAIVSDLLDLSSLATGKLKLNLEPIELEPFCQEIYQQVLTKLKALAPDNPDTCFWERDFELTIESGINTAIADRLRLRQILSHLLTNSLKFSRPHGKVGIKIDSCDHWTTITVWDNGMGIAETKQRSLLQPLIESQNSSSDVKQGTGLGAIIAQQLAKAHGGDISFISRVNQGSEFTLLLPSQPIDSNRLGQLNQLPAKRAASSLVLVVETISSRIATITSWLRDLGYHSIVARSGTEALHKARQLKPGSILLNPNLPLLSGKDVLTLLKSDPRTDSSSVYVIATKENLASNRNLYQQADGFVCTPLEAIDLAKILPVVNKQSTNSANSQTLPQFLSPKALTILCLYPEPEFVREYTANNISNSSFNLKDWAEKDWTNYYTNLDRENSYQYRIIEADGLEQAHMLARIWQLDTIVLDGSGLKEPLTYLRSLQELESLATLPLVTLDAATTEAANQTNGLAVYPCLLPAVSRNNIDLMQVIRIAAGIDEQ